MNNWDFEPLWEYTNKESLAFFSKFFLTECSIFKRGTGLFRKIRKACDGQINLFFLFWGLAGEFAEFFLTEKEMAGNHLSLPIRFIKSVSEIYHCKDDLIALGVVKKEVSFDQKLEPIIKWAEKVLSHSPMFQRRRGELEARLYPYFRSLTNLTHHQISIFIANILKCTGLEKDSVKKISDKIRKRLKRREIQRDLDIERLRKSLVPLLMGSGFSKPRPV
jgi:hypothetical protein